MMLDVSIIIPARNAAATLGETIESVRAQTHVGWEAIVVNDGSTDGTSAVAGRFAASDPRIRVIETPAAGVSAARNAGVAAARHPWLLFLDADDLIRPEYLDRMTGRIAGDSGLDAVYCAWVRLTPDGRELAAPLSSGSDLFAEFTSHCVFAVHACVVRTSLVEAAGGFDPTLRTCEEFDFWQRVARTGARFAALADKLALYRMRPDSASLDGRQLLADGLRVIAQGHGPDPRVPAPAPAYAQGRPPAECAAKQAMFACWSAGLVIGKGDDAVPLLDALPPGPVPLLPEQVAHHLFQSVALGRCVPTSSWFDFWPQVCDRNDRFLEALEARTGTVGLQREARKALEDAVLQADDTRLPAAVGRTCGIAVELTRPVTTTTVPAGIERATCRVAYDGSVLGTLRLPVFDGRLAGDVLADAAAAEFAWTLLRIFLQQTLGESLEQRDEGTHASVWRGSVCLARDVPAGVERYSAEVHQQAGWTVFLQELWARPDWTQDRFYDPHLAETARTVQVRDGWVTVEVGAPLPDVVVHGGALTVVVQVGGRPIGQVPMTGDRIPAAALRAAITHACGFELCRAALREGVVGQPCGDGRSLHARLAEAAARRSGSEAPRVRWQIPAGVVLAPGWEDVAARIGGTGPRAALLARHRHGPIDSAASRRATLPAAAAKELDKPGTDVLLLRPGSGRDAPERVLYVPDLLWQTRPDLHGLPSPGAARRDVPADPDDHHRGVFERWFAAGADPWKYTSAYEQVKYEQTLSLLPAGPIHRALEVGCAEGHFTRQLAGRVGHVVAADFSRIALQRAAGRCEDMDGIEFIALDLARDPLPGGFDLIVCSELLYYMDDRRRLAEVARKLAGALNPGGYLLHAHAHLVVDQPERTGFDWDHPFGAEVIGQVFAATPPFRLVRELRTPLYRIQLFGTRGAPDAPDVTELDEQPTPLLPEVERHVRWQGGSPRRNDRRETRTAALPILMYHRVAAAGVAALDRYRVTPADFEMQLAYLRDCGYHSVTLETWREAMASHSPLPGRAILLTFDDGYEDFATEAWPLLERYGFSATVFVVADEIGRVSSWDRAYGPPAPLLDWADIRRLQARGVEFGSHTATHRRLTAIAPEEIAREVVRGRAVLSRELGTPVDALAYPYGAVDPVVRHLAGACGHTFGLTCQKGRAGLWDAPLALPRIEVRGDEGFAEFVANLGEASE